MASRSQSTAKTKDVAPGGPATPTAQDNVAGEHFLTFAIAGAAYGLKLSTVAEIIRMPVLSFMPLVPPSLLGLANLRGTVLPVISLRRLLNVPDAAADDSTRVIVVNGVAPVGFVVDRIDGLLVVPPEEETPAKILDPAQLLRGQFDQLGVSGKSDAARSSVAPGAATAETQALVAMLSFDIGTQEYALPLDSVREIVALPDHLPDLPHSESSVLGVITLRDRLLPLVSLRALLGLPAGETRSQRGKVIVVSLGDALVGVVVDATREILRVDPSVIDAAPALLSRGAGEADVTSMARLNHGRRLVAVLSPDRLFRSELLSKIAAEQGSSGEEDNQSGSTAMADEQFIVFRLGGQEYAMPIAAVSEIARTPEHITRVPKAPSFIDGVINLRGGVVPVVDLRRRFDIQGADDQTSQRILVLGFAGARAGFLVDSVAEVLKVSSDAIRPAPDLSPDQMRLMPRVINLEDKGRMILLVDPAQLLDKIESDILAKFDSTLDQASTPT
ncbi:MAG: chemotaxis protein CheW [Pseudolabrys sp.]|nr:chemotaxis protein CheW [Pseudolabrys sp.]